MKEVQLARDARVWLLHDGRREARVVDSQGRFDFGPRPIGFYTLIAEAPGRGAVRSSVDLRTESGRKAGGALVVQLAPCDTTFSGSVVDPSGRGIAGARVSFTRGEAVSVSTEADGKFAICSPDELPIVFVSAKNFGSQTESLLSPRRNLVRRFILWPEATIEGTVVYEDGTPVPGAQVEPPDEGPWWDKTPPLVADAEGHFQIGGLEPGVARIRASAPSRVSSRSKRISLEPGGRSTGIVLRLERGTTLRGRVVGARGPLADVQVRASDTFGRESTARSGASGAFVLEQVPLGAVRVEAVYGYEDLATQRVDSATVHVVPDLRVFAESTICGRLLEDGRPLAGARVGPLSRVFDGAVTDAEGRFAVRWLQAGAHVLLVEIDARHLPGGHRVEVARGATRDGVTIEVHQGVDVRGRVVDTMGVPVGDVDVSLRSRSSSFSARAGSDGVFRVTGVLPGGYEATVHVFDSLDPPLHPGGRNRLAVRSFPVQAGDLVVTYPHLAIAGHVTDESGVGRGSVHVRIAEEREGRSEFEGWRTRSPRLDTWTEPDGKFRFEDLPAGVYSLDAQAFNGDDATLMHLAASSDGVEIELRPAGTIHGHVGGVHIPVSVLVMRTDSGYSESAEPDEAGNFVVSHAPAGEYELSVREGGETAQTRIVLPPGGDVQAILESTGIGHVSGTVSDFDSGEKLEGFRCDYGRVVREPGQEPRALEDWRQKVNTDADGRFEIDDAPAGEVEIRCYPENMENRSGAEGLVRLAKGGKVTVELRSVHGDRAHGRGLPGMFLSFSVPEPTIKKVYPGSDAERAGLRAGDSIVAVDGQSTEHLGEGAVMVLIMRHAPGDIVKLTIARDGKRIDLELSPSNGTAPATPSAPTSQPVPAPIR